MLREDLVELIALLRNRRIVFIASVKHAWPLVIVWVYVDPHLVTLIGLHWPALGLLLVMKVDLASSKLLFEQRELITEVLIAYGHLLQSHVGALDITNRVILIQRRLIRLLPVLSAREPIESTIKALP